MAEPPKCSECGRLLLTNEEVDEELCEECLADLVAALEETAQEEMDQL